MKINQMLLGCLVLASVFSCADEKFASGPMAQRKEARISKPQDEDQLSKRVIYDETQDVSSLVKENISLKADGFVELNFTSQISPPKSKTFTQLERELVSDSFTQGTSGVTHEQKFALREARLLDLLIVVDNSSSMQEEQQRLMNKLDPLLSEIDDVDWQIGVVTTSSSCLRRGGNSVGVIKKSDPDVTNAFKNAVNAGINGDSIERGVLNAIKGLKGECLNTTTPWLRRGASVGVMFVTDEDNCGSDAGGCPEGEYGAKAIHMTDYLDSLRASGMINEARAYGIFWNPATICRSAFQQARAYKQIVDQTGGTSGSICDNDYTQTLQAISQNVNNIIHREFVLDANPDNGTVQMFADGIPVTDGFTVTNNKIILSKIPAGTDLVVKYVTGSTEKKRRFTVSKQPSKDTLQVSIDGNNVNTSEYSFDETSQQLVFVSVPADLAEIKINYRIKTPLLRKVALDGPVMASSVTVTNEAGQRITDFTFDTLAAEVNFQTPPSDGKKLFIKFNTTDDIVTKYSVNAGVVEIYELKVKDRDTGHEIPFTYIAESNEIEFNKDDLITPKRITISYLENMPTEKFKVTLNAKPHGDSLKIELPDTTNTCADYSVINDANELIIPCSSSEVALIEISYLYYKDMTYEFKIPSKLAVSSDLIHVFIDGKETSEYAFKNGKIVIDPELLQLTSQIRIVIEEEYAVKS